jgi:hypothetical protein
MVRKRASVAWIVAACAAVVIQAAPQALCLSCDQPCCTARADHGNAATPIAVEPANGCPLCTASADHPARGAGEPPCHCQLSAREPQTLSPPRGTAKVASDGVFGSSAAIPPALVPPVIGVSREYLAGLLTGPIRPPRILFGVWRN